MVVGLTPVNAATVLMEYFGISALLSYSFYDISISSIEKVYPFYCAIEYFPKIKKGTDHVRTLLKKWHLARYI